MKRKATHKATPARMQARAAKSVKQQTKRVDPAPAAADSIDLLVTASAEALGLPIDPTWQPGVAFNLRLILCLAALVDEFPVPDDAEPAPVFHA
jgi:1-carboxybiuret hydrolase subunit AtzG-like protein